MRALARVATHPLTVRFASAVVTLFGVTIVIFVILRVLPGNQITAALGVNAGLLSPAQLHALREFYGLDRSVPAQYFSWLGSIFHGNFGVSTLGQQPVSSLLASAFPVTLELAIMATLLGLLVGTAAGVLSASRPNGVRDAAGQGYAIFGLGVPSFVIGAGLVSVLAYSFSYFPNSQGYESFTSDPWLNLQQIFFPALTLSFGIGAAIMRTTRSAVLDVSRQNFVRTARGKGVPAWLVTWRHVFRNALMTIVTMAGIQFGYLLGGTVIVEQIFVLPGLGRMLLTGIQNRDYAAVQSAALVFAAGFVLVNFVVDLLYAWIDPRVRTS